MAIPPASQQEISGRSLHGDDFSSEQVQEWYDREVTGYFDLLSEHYKVTDADNKYDYGYDALNQFQLDCVTSETFRWNARYWRDSFAKKLVPTSAFWVLKRTAH